MKYLAASLVVLAVYSKMMPDTISLRPKPKARAGGADGSGAAVYSFAYLSHVFIGSERGHYTLIISVLENDIWVMNAECKNCKDTYIQYNSSESSMSSPTGKTTTYKHEVLNLDAEGKYYTDLVQIDENNSTVYKVAAADKFIDVYGLSIDGIVGLGKDNTSIVYQMYNEKKIDSPTYSLSYLNSPLLILGTPNFLDLSLVVSKQQEISIANSLVMTKFVFSDHEVTEHTKVELNSMSSYITGPPEILESIYKILTSEGCHYEEELLMCECEGTDYPTFDFEIQSQILTLTSHEYLIQLGEHCFLALKSGEHWILGEPFFKGYFTEFNLKRKTLTLYKTTALTTQMPSPFDTTEGLGVVISLGIGSIAIYVVVFVFYLKFENMKIARAKQLSRELAMSKPRTL